MRGCHHQMIADYRSATDVLELLTLEHSDVRLPRFLPVKHFRAPNDARLSTSTLSTHH